MTIVLLISFAWAMGCLAYSSYWTNRGIRLGVALEDNRLITWLTRTAQPTFWELYVSQGAVRVIFLLLGLLLPAPTAYPAVWQAIATAVLVVAGFKNLQGGRQWLWMIAHPGQKLPVMGSVWKKIVGFWG